MSNKISSIIKLHLRGFAYLKNNLSKAEKMAPISRKQHGDYIFSGLQPSQVSELAILYRSICGDRPLNNWKKAMLKYRGSRLCGIIMDGNEKIIGFQLHSFSRGALPEGIIYLEFSGIAPQERGKGLAIALRKHTANHFSNQGIKGLLAITNANNASALQAARKTGYRMEPAKSKKHVKLYLDFTENGKNNPLLNQVRCKMDPSAKYKTSPIISYKDEGDEGAVLYNPDIDKALIINSVGAAIWRFIEKPRTASEIVSMLTENFSGVDPEQARNELKQFLNDFEEGFVDEIS